MYRLPLQFDHYIYKETPLLHTKTSVRYKNICQYPLLGISNRLLWMSLWCSDPFHLGVLPPHDFTLLTVTRATESSSVDHFTRRICVNNASQICKRPFISSPPSLIFMQSHELGMSWTANATEQIIMLYDEHIFAFYYDFHNHNHNHNHHTDNNNNFKYVLVVT